MDANFVKINRTVKKTDEKHERKQEKKEKTEEEREQKPALVPNQTMHTMHKHINTHTHTYSYHARQARTVAEAGETKGLCCRIELLLALYVP